MPYYSVEEIITCSECGAVNKVTFTYSTFGPENQERETGECVSCGKRIVSKKCFSIMVKKAK